MIYLYILRCASIEFIDTIYPKVDICSTTFETREISEKEIEELTTFDQIMQEDINIVEYIEEDKDNIIFVFDKSDEKEEPDFIFYPFNVSYIKDLYKCENLLFECIDSKGGIYAEDILMKDVYIRMGIDPTNSALSAGCIKRIIKQFNKGYRVFMLGQKKKLESSIPATNIMSNPGTGENIFLNRVDLVSSAHCTPGSQVYYWDEITFIKIIGDALTCNVM